MELISETDFFLIVCPAFCPTWDDTIVLFKKDIRMNEVKDEIFSGCLFIT